MSSSFEQRLAGEIGRFKSDGVYKKLNYIDGPQGSRVQMPFLLVCVIGGSRDVWPDQSRATR